MAMSLSCASSIFTPKKPSTTPLTFNFPSHSPSISSSFLRFTSQSCTRHLSSSTFVPKLSQTEAPSVESEAEAEAVEVQQEAEAVEFEQAEQTLTTTESKGEDVFAVVMIGGRQYIVFPGRFLYTQRLKGANVDDKIILNKVLLVGTKNSTYIGKPIVPNAAVHAVVEEQGLDPKVVVFKYKKKKNYRRNIGHRQPNTRIRILGITGYQDSPASTLP
ncbi:putative ribosomal protein L21 [Helianthus annuus]|nr:putative ribosomal protein L21 [Helianthus annuus]KAJ0757020.1 putative ribosomal protein L21 [Helianthus annuus]KAJ0760755.1 putative ribosomal protein L21 [Helianthus annuus]